MRTTPTKARISRVWIERRNQTDLIGIIAKASVISASGVRQTMNAGGLWVAPDHEDIPGIESAQLHDLRSELASFGFGQRAIDYAFKRVERKEAA